MEDKHCRRCDKEVETKIIQKKETYDVLGKEKIEVVAYVRVCSDCGYEFWDSRFDNGNLIRAYNVYRERHGLLMPDEIRNIRTRAGYEQNEFDYHLGLTPGSIKRYENGSLQCEDDDAVIRACVLSGHEAILVGAVTVMGGYFKYHKTGDQFVEPLEDMEVFAELMASPWSDTSETFEISKISEELGWICEHSVIVYDGVAGMIYGYGKNTECCA